MRGNVALYIVRRRSVLFSNSTVRSLWYFLVSARHVVFISSYSAFVFAVSISREISPA